MAGHNKWTQIKRQKGVEDAKKSKLFGVLGKSITIETKKSNGDRNVVGLRTAIEKARAANMPNENIERAIKNATVSGNENLSEVAYEAYGPGGTALIIEGITDNNNRSAQEIKHLLSLHDSKLATPGAVLWAFQKIDGEWRAVNPRNVTDLERRQLNELVSALENKEAIKKVTTNLIAR